jgi:hypothetical protein
MRSSICRARRESGKQYLPAAGLAEREMRRLVYLFRLQ